MYILNPNEPYHFRVNWDLKGENLGICIRFKNVEIYAIRIFVTYFLSNSSGVFFTFTLIAVQPSVLSPLAKNNCTRLFRSNLKYFTQKNKQHRCVYVNMEVMQKKGYIFFFGSYCVHKFLKSSRVKAEKCIVLHVHILRFLMWLIG